MRARTCPYLPMAEVCRILGFAPTAAGAKSARELLVAKVRRGKGKLDQYDPRVGRGAWTRYRVTRTTLKKLCPECFDAEVELAEELRDRLAELQAQIDKLGARLAREEKMSRGRDDVLADGIRKLRAGR